MKILKVKKKEKGKVAQYRLLQLPVLDLNKTANESESVLVVTGIKNEKEREAEIDIVKEGTEVEVEIEIAVEREIVAEKDTEAVIEIVVVKEIAFDATAVARLTVRVITEETKTEIVETAKIGIEIETEIENQSVNEANVGEIGKNPAKRKRVKKVAVLRWILKLLKPMPCVLN